MSKLRAIAIDVDGTLLNPSHEITVATARTLRELTEKGIKVILASARHVESLRRILRELEVAGLVVAFSGGAAARVDADGNFEVLFESRLPLQLAEAVAQRALTNGLDVGWYDLGQWYAPSDEAWYAHEARILRQQPTVVAGLKGIGAPPNKLQLVGHDQKAIDLLHEVQATAPAEFTAVFSHHYMLEILPAGTNKARGLTRAGREIGLRLEEMVAFGDADNDLEMLRDAAVGVAMGHAPQAVRAAADRVTLNNAEDGVAVALQQDWLLERLFPTSNLQDA